MFLFIGFEVGEERETVDKEESECNVETDAADGVPKGKGTFLVLRDSNGVGYRIVLHLVYGISQELVPIFDTLIFYI